MKRRHVRSLVESTRRSVLQERGVRSLGMKKPKRSRAQRNLDRLVSAELALMGIEQRALDVAEAMKAPDFAAQFEAARDHHGPYEGARGYEELRTTLLDVLRSRGVDVAGVTVRFQWDGSGTLRADVVATPEAQRTAEASVKARLEAAVAP